MQNCLGTIHNSVENEIKCCLTYISQQRRGRVALEREVYLTNKKLDENSG